MNDRKIRKLMQKSVPIETERLIIRRVDINDAYDMYEYSSIPEVSEFLLWSPHVNLSATEGYIESLKNRYLKGLYADWAVVLKVNNKMIGTCGYASFDTTNKQCEIGYVLSPHYRKKGYMTEAVKAVVDLSFNTLNLSKIILRIIKENKDSIKLAKQLGFEFEYETTMIIKDVVRKVEYYSLYNK